MKKILLLLSISILSATAFSYTITHDDGYTFDGYCKAGVFNGFFDVSTSYGHICAGGNCINGRSKHEMITRACGE